MKKLFKLIVFLLLGTISYAKEPLYIGTNAEFVPFEYIENGEIVGFDIELIKEVGKKIDRNIVIKNIAFDGLLPALQTNKIDAIIAGMTITKEREKFVDFSDNYFVANQVIIVPEKDKSTKSLGSLKDKKVGVVLGYTGDLIISKDKEIKKIQYNSAPTAIMALNSGKIDAVILDSAPAENYIENNKGLKIVTMDIKDEKYAIAIKKGQKELVENINKALNELKNDGTYNKLINKYFN